MPSTSVATETLKKVLSEADPNRLSDALRKVDLGNLLTVKEWDSGAITASATVTLPEKALAIQSARVVTSGTANSVGSYLVADAGATGLTPTAGANVGLAKVDAAGQVLTFLTTVTRVVVRYVPASVADMTAKFDIA